MASAFYANPSYMSGGSFTIYSGSRRQRGGGFLGSMRNIMAPVGRNVLRGLKTAASNKTVQKIAKAAARKGTEVLAGVAVDALQGRDIRESINSRAKQAALEALTGNSEPAPKRRKVSIKSQPKSSYVNTEKKLKQKSRLAKVVKSSRRKKRLSRAELNRKDLF